MRISRLFDTMLRTFVDALWLAGGIGAAADLGLDEYGSAACEPCPLESEYPCCAHPEAIPCPLPCSSSSPLRPSR